MFVNHVAKNTQRSCEVLMSQRPTFSILNVTLGIATLPKSSFQRFWSASATDRLMTLPVSFTLCKHYAYSSSYTVIHPFQLSSNSVTRAYTSNTRKAAFLH
jgi:hypothetical protein